MKYHFRGHESPTLALILNQIMDFSSPQLIS